MTYTIIRKDTDFNVMEVEYILPGGEVILVGMPLTIGDELDTDIIARYIPHVAVGLSEVVVDNASSPS